MPYFRLDAEIQASERSAASELLLLTDRNFQASKASKRTHSNIESDVEEPEPLYNPRLLGHPLHSKFENMIKDSPDLRARFENMFKNAPNRRTRAARSSQLTSPPPRKRSKTPRRRAGDGDQREENIPVPAQSQPCESTAKPSSSLPGANPPTRGNPTVRGRPQATRGRPSGAGRGTRRSSPSPQRPRGAGRGTRRQSPSPQRPNYSDWAHNRPQFNSTRSQSAPAGTRLANLGAERYGSIKPATDIEKAVDRDLYKLYGYVILSKFVKTMSLYSLI